MASKEDDIVDTVVPAAVLCTKSLSQLSLSRTITYSPFWDFSDGCSCCCIWNSMCIAFR